MHAEVEAERNAMNQRNAADSAWDAASDHAFDGMRDDAQDRGGALDGVNRRLDAMLENATIEKDFDQREHDVSARAIAELDVDYARRKAKSDAEFARRQSIEDFHKKEGGQFEDDDFYLDAR